MESSDFSSANTSAGANDNTGTTGASMGASSGSSTSSGMGDGTAQSSGLADRARGAVGSAGERLGEVGSSLRDRAGTAKDSLANVLEAGAERLRARSGDGAMAASSVSGGSTAVADDRMTQVTTRVASGMDGAAEWLRDADLNNLKSSVEQQVKDHPGRTLLIAVGLGYMLGKALRK